MDKIRLELWVADLDTTQHDDEFNHYRMLGHRISEISLTAETITDSVKDELHRQLDKLVEYINYQLG